VSKYDVVLFLHLMSAVFGFGVAAVAHTTLFRLRSATDMRQVRDELPVLEKSGPLFPIAGILLLALGAWLIQLSPSGDKFSYSDGWVLTGIVSLVVVEGVGGAVIGRRVKALVEKFGSVADGPLDAETRAQLTDRPVWVAAHFNTAVIAAVVLIMVTKPSGVGSVVTVAIGAVLGIVSALPFAKPVPVAA
jgi:hypothetical protein